MWITNLNCQTRISLTISLLKSDGKRSSNSRVPSEWILKGHWRWHDNVTIFSLCYAILAYQKEARLITLLLAMISSASASTTTCFRNFIIPYNNWIAERSWICQLIISSEIFLFSGAFRFYFCSLYLLYDILTFVILHFSADFQF